MSLQLKVKGARFEVTIDFMKAHSQLLKQVFRSTDDNPDILLIPTPPAIKFYQEKGQEPSGEKEEGESVKWIFEISHLNPEFVGTILVSLRKGKHTFRFSELEEEQRKSLMEIVDYFGFQKLQAELVSLQSEKKSVQKQDDKKEDSDEDDGMELPSVTCGKCGCFNQHVTSDCPFSHRPPEQKEGTVPVVATEQQPKKE